MGGSAAVRGCEKQSRAVEMVLPTSSRLLLSEEAAI